MQPGLYSTWATAWSQELLVGGGVQDHVVAARPKASPLYPGKKAMLPLRSQGWHHASLSRFVGSLLASCP